MTTASATSAASPEDERLALVRAHDLDRYISLLLAPPALRADLLTVLAFDAELARIPATVSEPLIGEIRLQWWRDALSPLLADAGRTATDVPTRTGNRLCDDLLALARRQSLPGSLVHGMIDARSAELAEAPLADEAQLLSYVGKVYGGLTGLLARVADPPKAGGGQPASALDAGARAIGLIDVARRLAAHRPHADLLVPASLWPIERRDGEQAEGERRRAAAAMAKLAMPWLERCRAGLAEMPPRVRPALLPIALLPGYMRQIERLPTATGTRDLNPLKRLWTLWRARHKKIMV